VTEEGKGVEPEWLKSHSTVRQTVSSTHWQYPPKRCSPLSIVLRPAGSTEKQTLNILGLIADLGNRYVQKSKAQPKPRLEKRFSRD
jgi:hypothetical protein